MAVEIATAYISIIPETRRVAPAVRKALNETVGDAQKSGEAHGDRFSKGFSSKMGSGIVGIAAGFKVAGAAVGVLVRNVGVAATAIGIAARLARGFSVSLLASATALRAVAGVSLAKLAGVLKLVAVLASRVATQISRITSAILVLAAVGRALSFMTNFARTLRNVTIGAALAIGVISGLSTIIGGALVKVLTVAGAALGAFAGAAVGILAPALAVLKLGISGLSAGMKAFGKGTDTKGAESQAKAIASATKGIATAEKGVVSAKKDARNAEKDLTRARKDAQQQIEDLNLALRDNSLSEREAALAVRQAREDLASTLADPTATATDRIAASQRVERAELSLVETQQQSREEAVKADKANKDGIEGADGVVQAKEKVAEANQAVTDSEMQVVEARQALIDAQNQDTSSNSVDPFDAMIGQRMAPMLTAFKDLSHAVTDEFSLSLVGAFSNIGTLLDALSPKLASLSGVFGKIGTDISASIASPDGIAAFQSMTDSSNRFFTSLSGADSGLSNLVLGMSQFIATAASVVSGSGGGLNDLFTRLGNALRNISADQIQGTFETLKTSLTNVKNVVAPFISLFSQVGKVSAEGLAPGFSSVGAAIKEATPGLVAMSEKLMPSLGKVMTNLAPLLPKLVDAFTPWSTILAALAPVIADVITFLGPMAPVLLLIVTGVKALSAAMAIYNSIMLVVTNATKVWTAVQWLWNAAMTANPIGLIIAGIALLIGALVLFFTKTEIGRKIWSTVWDAIKTAVSAAWSFIKPIWDGFVSALGWIGDKLNWLWQNVIKPVFGFIGGLISGWWNNVVKPVFNTLTTVLEYVGQVAEGVFNKIIKPAFEALGAAIKWVWDNVLSPVWDFFKFSLEGLGIAFTYVWQKVIEPIWNALGAGIKWVWDKVVSPAWDAMKKGLDILKDSFKTAVDFIGNIWDGIKKVIAIPINFVIDKVLNGGILKSWNTIARFLDVPEIPDIPLLPGFSQGGYTGTGGRLTPAGIVHKGEYVLDQATTNRIGVENLDRIRGGASADGMASLLPGYAAGGEVEAPLNSAHEFARSMNGQAYLMGGSAPGPMDCSAFMSAIADVIIDGSTHGRKWSTTAFPDSQTGAVNAGGQSWVGGLGEGFSIGVKGGAGSGGANGHTAGTLSATGLYKAVNVESGGSHGDVAYGGPAAGADSSQFPTQWHLPIIDGLFQSAGPGEGGGGIMNWFRNKVADLFEKPVRALGGIIPEFGGDFGKAPRALYNKVADSAINFIRGKADGKDTNSSGDVTPGSGPVQDQVREAMMPYGWDQGAQWDALSWIVDKESGWNPTARNPSSGAFGLAQFLGSTKDAYLPDENPNPKVQGSAMAKYIKDRYGDPMAAKSFWMDHNWYDQGGMFPNNSIGINQSGKPEAVLTNDQWKLFAKFIEQLQQGKVVEAFQSFAPAPAADPYTVPEILDPSTYQQSQPTAVDFQARATQAGGDFLSANFEGLLGDLGARSSGGAVQELVKVIQDQMAAQVADQLKRSRANSSTLINRR